MKTKKLRFTAIILFCVLLLGALVGCIGRIDDLDSGADPNISKNGTSTTDSLGTTNDSDPIGTTEAITVVPSDLSTQNAEPNSLTEEAFQQLNEVYTNDYDANGFYIKGLRHYGTYDGCIVLFYRGQMAAQAMTTVYAAGEEFYYSSRFSMYAYKDGQFAKLQDAYENGWITKEAIHTASMYHESLLPIYMQRAFIEIDANAAPDSMSQEKLDEFIEAFNTRNNYQLTSMTHYGTYDGTAVFFAPLGGEKAKTYKINGFDFSYSENFIIIYFKNGRFEKYNPTGYLSDEQIETVYEYHQSQQNK